MGEARKYKYLVDVCELVDTALVSVDTGCSPGDAPRVRVDFESKNGEAWHIFDRMLNYKDEILFYVASYGWQLLTLDGLNVRHTAGAMDFMVFSLSKFFERDEFVKELKKITSVDDIVKSHVDEPGKRGGLPVKKSRKPVFVHLGKIFGAYMEEPSPIGDGLIIHAKTSPTVVEFIKEVREHDEECMWFCSVPGYIAYYELSWIQEHGDEIILKLTMLQPSDVRSIFFSEPMFAGPRESYPTITVSKKEEEKMLEHFKELFEKKEVTVESENSLEDVCAEIYRGLGLPPKSTAELAMELMKKSKSGMLTYKREDVCGKIPQLHRARLNKPKSI